jgi:hypothetical protein
VILLSRWSEDKSPCIATTSRGSRHPSSTMHTWYGSIPYSHRSRKILTMKWTHELTSEGCIPFAAPRYEQMPGQAVFWSVTPKESRPQDPERTHAERREAARELVAQLASNDREGARDVDTPDPNDLESDSDSDAEIERSHYRLHRSHQHGWKVLPPRAHGHHISGRSHDSEQCHPIYTRCVQRVLLRHTYTNSERTKNGRGPQP